MKLICLFYSYGFFLLFFSNMKKKMIEFNKTVYWGAKGFGKYDYPFENRHQKKLIRENFVIETVSGK